MLFCLQKYVNVDLVYLMDNTNQQFWDLIIDKFY